MKKVEKQLESARTAAANAREAASFLAFVASFAPIGAAMTAPKVLPMVPGPTEEEFAEALKARKTAISSKKVLLLGGLTAGLVFFGGKSIESRTAAAVAGAYTGSAIDAWNAAALALSDPDALKAMVVEVKK